MSSTERDARLAELVAAFSEVGPAWIRWVQAAIPDEAVSYARLRAFTALASHPGGLTMTQVAAALGVTARRVTVLVDALAEGGLVARYAHPSDRRSTIVRITNVGRSQQHRMWHEHQSRASEAFGALSNEDQVHLLRISLKLTAAFRRHLAERAASIRLARTGDPDAVTIDSRRVRRARRLS